MVVLSFLLGGCNAARTVPPLDPAAIAYVVLYLPLLPGDDTVGRRVTNRQQIDAIASFYNARRDDFVETSESAAPLLEIRFFDARAKELPFSYNIATRQEMYYDAKASELYIRGLERSNADLLTLCKAFGADVETYCTSWSNELR